MLSRWSCLTGVVVVAGLLCARDLSAANRVARIDVEQAGPHRTVRIATDEAPVFATYTLDEAHQVVIDIAEGDLRHVSGPLEVRDGVLGDVSLQQFQMGPLRVGRVTVALSVLCSTVVQAEGNAIIVHACNGATDIRTEPVLVASTEAIGVEAFTALAQGAATLAALGPDLGDDAEAFAEGEADQMEGRLAEAAYGAGDPTENGEADDQDRDNNSDSTGMPSNDLAARAATPEPQHAPLARAPRHKATRQATQQAAAHPAAVQATKSAKAMRRAMAARVAMAAAQKRNAARLAKNRAILAMAERRFARRAAARARAKQRLALAAARPTKANKRAARRAALAMLAAQRAEAAAKVALERTANTLAQAGSDGDVGDDGPIVIRGRRFAEGVAPAAPEVAVADVGAVGDDGARPGPILIQGRRFAHKAAGRAHKSTLVAVQRVEKSQILLRVKGSGRIKSRHLADPPRFVVDLGGIRRDTGEKFYALDTDLRASRVRLGDQDFGVRAVFDLRDHHTQARVRRTKDGILVAFSGRLGSPAPMPPRAKARKQQPKEALQEEAMLDPQDEQDLQTQHDLQTAADLQAEQDAQANQAPRAVPKAPRSDLPVLHPRGKSG